VSKFLERFETDVRLRCRLSRRQKILAAVSGGLDSMTLLHALHALAKQWGWCIVVAHFNHQLRGRSSDADENLVRKTAAALGLPFVSGRADVKSFAQRSKLSIEMAARKLRHEFFTRVASERNISSIALAHHADDQVELFFLRVLRGAGGRGLAGMKWCAPSPAQNRIKIIRPLLGFKKSELLQFARKNKFYFREDSTNARSDILRNRIRNELLPLLEKKYQPGLTKLVLRLMEIVGAESDAIGELSRNWLKQRGSDFDNLPAAVQRRVLQSQLTALDMMPDFGLVESLRNSADILFNIDSKFSVSRDTAGNLSLHKHLSPTGFNTCKLVVNLADTGGTAKFGGLFLSWHFEANTKNIRSHKIASHEFFDADMVGDEIILRHWQPGDRFQPIGMKTAAKLQDLFTNAKVPRDQRRDLIVAATTAGGKIFWIEGLRISENFKVTSQTRRRLVWHWRHSIILNAKSSLVTLVNES
jgi:tRNA(Ile)-lysidine synthase